MSEEPTETENVAKEEVPGSNPGQDNNEEDKAEADKAAPPVSKKELKEQFEAFAKFGDKAADGKTIKLSQSDKWFKQAKVIDPKMISTTDTGIAFRKISKYVSNIIGGHTQTKLTSKGAGRCQMSLLLHKLML